MVNGITEERCKKFYSLNVDTRHGIMSWSVGIGRDFSCYVDEFYSLSVYVKCVMWHMLGRIGIGRGLFMMMDVT